jgi:hypothetical protein
MMEDIQERLDEDLRNMRGFLRTVEVSRQRGQPVCAHDEVIARVKKTSSLIKKTRHDIDAVIDLLSDPSFDSVAYTVDLRMRLGALEQRVARKDREMALLTDRHKDQMQHLVRNVQSTLAEKDLKIAELERILGNGAGGSARGSSRRRSLR